MTTLGGGISGHSKPAASSQNPLFWRRNADTRPRGDGLRFPPPVVVGIRNALKRQTGSENGSVTTWLLFNIVFLLADYTFAALTTPPKLRPQPRPYWFFRHDAQFTQLVVVATRSSPLTVTSSLKLRPGQAIYAHVSEALFYRRLKLVAARWSGVLAPRVCFCHHATGYRG
jgi:hypothetical protein